MNWMDLIERIDKGLLLPQQEAIQDKNWFDQDTKELYQKNLKEQPEDWYYRSKKVVYNVNSEGYRSKEFKEIDWHKSIVIFGCSYVYGIGSAEDETISAFLEQITGMPVVNLGAAGSSPLFALHNSIILSEAYPIPKAVVIGWSSAYRCPYYNKYGVLHCGHWNSDKQKLTDVWCNNQVNPLINLKLTAKIFKELWNTKTNYYEFSQFNSSSNVIKCDYIQQIDKGRDLVKSNDGSYTAHNGRETNKKIAEQIAENLNL